MKDFFASRWIIYLGNAVLLLLTASTVFDASRHLLDGDSSDFSKIEVLLDGLGVIMISYGVVLEERGSLMKIFDFYPRLQNHFQEEIDHSTHKCGLILLIFGLLMEVSVELVKLPNTIANTEGIEGVVFGVGVFFAFVQVPVLLANIVQMARLRPEAVGGKP